MHAKNELMHTKEQESQTLSTIHDVACNVPEYT